MKDTDKFLVAIVIGVVLLVVVAVAVVLLKPESTYQPEGSPEGIAHNYLLALQKGDYQRAHGYLSPSIEGYPPNKEVFLEELESRPYQLSRGMDSSLAVEETKITGGRAVVTIRETRFSGRGLFQSSQYISTFTIGLQLVNDDWKITNSGQYFARCWNYEGGC